MQQFKQKINISKLRKKVENKNILITGASYGIGASLAYLLGKEGANLYLIARSGDKLRAMQRYFEQQNVFCKIFIIN